SRADRLSVGHRHAAAWGSHLHRHARRCRAGSYAPELSRGRRHRRDHDRTDRLDAPLHVHAGNPAQLIRTDRQGRVMTRSVDAAGAAPSPGVLTAATAYTPRERRFVLIFAVVGALIESMELNLLSFPMSDLAASFGVTNHDVVAAITAQSL